MKSLATHSKQATLATICVCSYKHSSMQLVIASYTHARPNETHSIANLQDLIPTLALVVCVSYNYAAKVGVKSCRFAT